MGRNPGESSKKTKIRKIAIVSVLGLSVIAFLIWGGPALGLYSMGGEEEDEVVVVEIVYDFYAFNMTDAITGVSLELVNCTPYWVSSIGLDDEDIAALTYSNFIAGTKKTNIDETDKFDVEDYEDKLVIFLLEQKYAQDKWVSPKKNGGIHYETMMNKSTDINLVAFERDGGGFTVNQTEDPKWTVQVKAITDAHESKLGFESPLFDFPNDVWNYTVIRLQCNETSKFANFDMPGAAKESVDGVYSYFYFSDDWTSVDFTDYALNIASTLGTDFEFLEIASGYGNLDSLITIYNTQN